VPREPSPPAAPASRRGLTLLRMLAYPLGALLLFWLPFQLSLVGIYRVASASMEPTLHCAAAPNCRSLTADDVLVVPYLGGSPKQGDLIAFHLPADRHACGGQSTYIKRVAGLPGQRFARRRGRISINAHRTKAHAGRHTASPAAGVIDVAPDGYFVIGDNTRISCDSRVFGTIPRRDIIGRVVAIIWPPGRITVNP